MNRDLLLLADIVRACDKVSRYISDGRDRFLGDEKTQDAVIRNIEIIGEAAKQLSDTVKSLAPEEPWRQIAGMRDKLIHQYFGVNLELVWNTASQVLPPFRAKMAEMLARLEASESS